MDKRNVLWKSFGFLLVAVLFLGIFSIRFSMLRKSEYPNGLDGFYYVIQAESFVVNMELENPDTECGYYIAGFISGVVGDSILGVKIWAALSSAIISLSIFTVIFVSLKKSAYRFLLSLLGMLFMAASVCGTAMSVNYINNQTGLFFLLFYIASLISAFKEKERLIHRIGNIVLSLVLLTLSFFSHKTSAGYGLLFTLFYLLTKFRDRKSNGRSSFPMVSCIFLLCGIVLVIILSRSPRFGNSFAFPSFAFLHETVRDAMGVKGLFGSIEITVCNLIAWIMIIALTAINRKISVEFFFVSIAYFPFWNLDTEMGYRMSLNGMIVGIPILFYMAAKFLDMIKIKNIIKVGFLTVAAPFLFALLIMSPSVYDTTRDPPFAHYKEIVETIHLEEDTLLIAHLGLNHTYTYYNDLKDCMNWLPNYPIAKDKVWRLAYQVNADRIREVLINAELEEIEREVKTAEKAKDEFHDYETEISQIKVKNFPTPYVLLPEQLWQDYLKYEDPEITETLDNWYNPSEVRPDYIRKEKNPVEIETDEIPDDQMSETEEAVEVPVQDGNKSADKKDSGNESQPDKKSSEKK